METPDDIRKGNDGGSFVEPGNAEDSFLFRSPPIWKIPSCPGQEQGRCQEPDPCRAWFAQALDRSGSEGDPAGKVARYLAAVPASQPSHLCQCDRWDREVCGSRAGKPHSSLRFGHGEKAPLNLADPSLAKFGFYGKEDAAHLDVVNSLAFSPDGKTLASGGYRTIKLWKRTPVSRKQGPKIPVPFDSKLAVSPANGLVASFGEGNGSVLWSLPEWKKIREVGKEIGLVNAVALIPNPAAWSLGERTENFGLLIGRWQAPERGKFDQPHPGHRACLFGGEIPIWPWPGKAR